MLNPKGTQAIVPGSVLSYASAIRARGSYIECLTAPRDLDRYAAALEALRLRSQDTSGLPLAPWLAARPDRRNWVPRTIILRNAGHVQAAMLLHEKTIAGIPTGYFRGGNSLGEPFLFCEAGQETWHLETALRLLLAQRRAFLVLIDRSGVTPQAFSPHFEDKFELQNVSAPVYWQHPLGATFDATVAPFGHRTRRNLRLALRRVARNGWQFLPQLNGRQLVAAVSHFSRHSTHPYAPGITARRLQLAAEVPGGFAMGLTDTEGRWLSCLIGRRTETSADIFWQSNAAGHNGESLCTAMRALFMQEEVARATPLIRYIGGTCSFMEHCCTPSPSVQTSIARPGLRLALTRRLLNTSLPSPAHPLRAHL